MQDKPLTHPGTGTTYASTIRKSETALPPAGTVSSGTPPGKREGTAPAPSPGHSGALWGGGETYAEVLKKQGGPQSVFVVEPTEVLAEIEEILQGSGNVVVWYWS